MLVYKNNATSKLAGSLTTGATAISVQTGEGARFPVAGGQDWFPLTLIKTDGTFEIVKCTSRTGDVLTVVRAQEGTTALAFAVADKIELRLTAAALDSIRAGTQTRQSGSGVSSSQHAEFCLGTNLGTPAAGQTGTIKIELPYLSTPATYIRFRIKIFNAAGGGVNTTIECGGCVTAGVWSLTSAILISGPGALLDIGSFIRFGSDGSNLCVLVGTVATVWDYLHVIVDEFDASGAGASISYDWSAGWTASLLTVETGITVDVSRELATGAIFSAQQSAGDNTAGRLLVVGADIDALGPNVAGKNKTQTYTAAQRGNVLALADAATITPDFAASNNFQVTLAGNRTIANPINQVAGQSGCISIFQDGVGGRTPVMGANWWSKSAPVFKTGPGYWTMVYYYVVFPGFIHYVAV